MNPTSPRMLIAALAACLFGTGATTAANRAAKLAVITETRQRYSSNQRQVRKDRRRRWAAGDRHAFAR